MRLLCVYQDEAEETVAGSTSEEGNEKETESTYTLQKYWMLVQGDIRWGEEEKKKGTLCVLTGEKVCAARIQIEKENNTWKEVGECRGP